MNIEIIFAEFGDRTISNQKWVRNIGRLDPTYSQVKQYFPDAKITAYTDRKHIKEVYPDVEIRMINMDECPFSGRDRCSNYCTITNRLT